MDKHLHASLSFIEASTPSSSSQLPLKVQTFQEQKFGRRVSGMAYRHYDIMNYPPGSGSSSSNGSTGNRSVRKTRSIRSEDAVSLQGPLDVMGSIKSGRNITLKGDFTVEDKIEAYGSIDIAGNVNCG